jgi:hypothetical protein
MAHFVIDAGLWRMRDPLARKFITEHLPYLVPTRSQSLPARSAPPLGSAPPAESPPAAASPAIDPVRLQADARSQVSVITSHPMIPSNRTPKTAHRFP